MPKSFYIIDGHAQMFRCYYAPFRDLSSPTGEPTKAVHVFCQMLLNLVRDRKPDYLAVAMDTSDETVFRKGIYPEYKSTRPPAPPDFHPQARRIESLLGLMGLPILKLAGYEADDIMATLAARHAGEDLHVYLVSKDKDLEQLLGPRVHLFDPSKNEVLDAGALAAVKGYTPEQALEIQSLIGDAIDNVPGIKGIGPKTAIKLIAKYGTAAAVIAKADDLPPKQRDNVKAFAPLLPVARELLTLRNDVPIEFDIEQARFGGFPVSDLLPVFDELALTRIRQQFSNLAGGPQEADGEETSKVDPQGLLFDEAAAPPGRYHLVEDAGALTELARRLAEQRAIGLTAKTSNGNAMSGDLLGIALSVSEGEAFYVPVSAGGAQAAGAAALAALRPILENPGIKKWGINVKSDLVVLRNAGIDLAGVEFDAVVASFILDPLRKADGVEFLAPAFLGRQSTPLISLVGKGKDAVTLDRVDPRRVADYAGEEADLAVQLRGILWPRIRQQGFENLLQDMEIPLLEVLAEMEHNGVALDTDLLARLSNEMADKLKDLTLSLHQAAGHPFNLDSPKQLATVLFDEQKLRVVRKTQTGRSTDAETLEALAEETHHPIPKLILAYRELAKLKNTYIDTLPEMINEQTGRVHASFNPTGAVTGRLSSSDPNLQNIPIRTEAGRQIRRAFVAGSPDTALLVADYSQVELRVLAHFCRDPGLLQAFENDMDVHAFVASQVFATPLDQVTSQQRSRAKAVNFGIIYGQTSYGLSRSTGMSVTEAQAFIDAYFARYPQIRSYIDACVASAKRLGYAETIAGRRRPLPELHSRIRQQYTLGERLAINTVIQGSAADLIKKAMIHIHRRIKDERLPLRMLIQVHDELVFECPAAGAEAMALVVREEMSHAMPLAVPIKVDVGWGQNWLDAK